MGEVNDDSRAERVLIDRREPTSLGLHLVRRLGDPLLGCLLVQLRELPQSLLAELRALDINGDLGVPLLAHQVLAGRSSHASRRIHWSFSSGSTAVTSNARVTPPCTHDR